MSILNLLTLPLPYADIRQEEGKLRKEEGGTATVARIALYFLLIEAEEEERGEVGDGHGQQVDGRGEPYERGQRGGEAEEDFAAAHPAVDRVALRLGRRPGIGQGVDDLGGGSLCQRVGDEHRHAGCLDGQAVEQGEIEGEVEEEPNDAVTTYARVLHDTEDARTVFRPASECVAAIGQAVFMQAAGQHQARSHSQQQGHGGREAEGGGIEHKHAYPGREPARQRPVGDDIPIGIGRDVEQTPEGEAGEEGEGCEDAYHVRNT